ncbi:Outer membrane protein beta-barrel domain-containing protein [Fodinibius salinus]|uniref:Outer membrane protein beta-barrel domain-containing protein n=1 Tax=Fodinibius salinus TaxID=860790 RepID=A0A5D3YPI5_9BACT|nr:outer membrane beta-barrel protein [Fodinibius salinus]TYP95148.1 Outer membrane protein beta-barrel domain-containing protein [Fodinibius salinus]
MKKLLTVSLLIVGIGLFFNNNAQAQDFKVGLGATYGTQIEAIGIQGGAVAGFSDQFRGAVDFKFFFPDNTDFWELNANLHYLFVSKASTSVYALAGLNYAKQSVSNQFVTVSNSEIGLNLGAGAEFGIGVGSFFTEAKYAVSNFDQFDISAGLRFGL